MKTLPKFLKSLQANPLWVLAWSVFTASVGMVATHEYVFPERKAYFQRMHTRLDALGGEFSRAEKLVALWSETLTALSDSGAALNASVSLDRLSPESLPSTTAEIVVRLRAQRQGLSPALAVFNNAYFELPALQELRSSLLSDLTSADAFIETAVSDLVRVAEDPSLAQREKSRRLLDIGAERASLEVAGRQPMIDHQLDIARHEFNDTLLEAQAQERMYKVRSKLAVAAWSYIGAFCGFVIGWCIRRIRGGGMHRREIVANNRLQRTARTARRR